MAKRIDFKNDTIRLFSCRESEFSGPQYSGAQVQSLRGVECGFRLIPTPDAAQWWELHSARHGLLAHGTADDIRAAIQ